MGILFSHPKDFTPVCTTELGYMAKLKKSLNQEMQTLKQVQIQSKSARTEKDIEETQNVKVNYPLIADSDLKLQKFIICFLLMNQMMEKGALTNATVRSVFLMIPQKNKMMLTYPRTNWTKFDEIIRVLDSVQLTTEKKVATPAQWVQDEEVIIVPAVSDEEATELFGKFRKVKPYLIYQNQVG